MDNIHACDECPYGKEDIENRKKLLGDDNYQPEYCWCEKVGGKHLLFGYCNEEDENRHEQLTHKKIKRPKNRYDRVLAEKKKINRLKRIINNGGYNPRIGYIMHKLVDGEVVQNESHILYPKNSNMQKWIKRETSHKIRKAVDVPSHNGYRRYVDYFWILY